MNEVMNEIEYEIAQGPVGLRTVLDRFLYRSQEDSIFAKQAHYILYQFNSQKSLIRVDMSQEPYQFWYNDLLGRPATKIVKDTIARFLEEKCGLKFKDLEEEGQ